MDTGTAFDTILDNPKGLARSRSSRRISKRKATTRSVATADRSTEEEVLPAIGTMARTKRLILAALRVWELKRGIRD